MNFTILMSVYRREQPSFLSQSLASIFNQTVPPGEVVLVKDGPLTEDLEGVISCFAAEHPELKVIPLAVNVGLGRALNEGLKHCSFELVARMDSDDVCKPFRFERQLEVFREHPEVDVCGSWVDEFSEDKEHVVSVRRLPEYHAEICKYAKQRCPVNHVTVVYRRDKVLNIGGYQGFPEDYYLWVKMILNHFQFYNLPESLVWVRFSPEVLKRRGGWRYAKDDVRAQWRFYRAGFLSIPELVRNVLVRGTVRLMPNDLRVWFYRCFLRK